ncbi:MAG TPA: BrnT family toxin [Thermoanaerobaculia bacterium]|nr:BrnT family toxin [Thermoanaerobaculia bacterium]
MTDHSFGEERFITIGVSSRGRVLFVAHADIDDRIRIISARRATRREANAYTEG